MEAWQLCAPSPGIYLMERCLALGKEGLSQAELLAMLQTHTSPSQELLLALPQVTFQAQDGADDSQPPL